MAEPQNSLEHNPKEAAILQLFQEKVEPKLAQIEKESQIQDSTLKKLQAEIDSLIKLGTTISKEIDEAQAADNNEPTSSKRVGLDMKIDVDGDTGANITAPQSTREVKTGGLMGGKNPATDPKNRRLSHQGKTDKPSSLTDVEGQNKETAQKGGKKPAPATRPVKNENKAENKTVGDKKGVGAKDKGKEHAEEEKKEEEPAEKTPEQIAADECKSIVKDLNKKDLANVAGLTSPPPAVLKAFEGALIALGDRTHTWANIQKVTKGADFTKKLENVKANTITSDNFKKIRQILGDDNLKPDAIGIISEAAKQVVLWLEGLVKVRDILKPGEAQEHADAIAADNAKKEEQERKKAEKEKEKADKEREKAEKEKEKAEKAKEKAEEKEREKAEKEKEKAEKEKEKAEKAKEKAEEREKAKNDKKPTIPKTPAPKTTKADPKDNKTKEPVEEEKKEEAQEPVEKTPDQIAADECKSILKDLNKKDLATITAFKAPPASVVKVFEGALIAIGDKTHTWANAQKVAKAADFTKKLESVKVDTISSDNFKKIRHILTDDNLKPDAIGNVSVVAKQIVLWLEGLVKVRDILKPGEVQEHADAIAAENAKKEEQEREKAGKEKEKAEEKEKAKNDKKADVPKTPAPKTTKADPKDKDDKKTTTKKEEKKDDKEDKDDKKPGVPKTIAPKTTKADVTKDKDDKKAATKAPEVQKPDLVHSHPDLKAIIEPLTNEEVTELKNKKIPSPFIATTLQAVCLLIQGKDHQWSELTKTILADIASLYKALDVDVNSFTKKNIEAAEKKLSDKNLEGSVTKAGGAVSILFKWVKTAVSLAKNKEQGAGSTQDVDKAAENKEEQKKEEPKEEKHTEEKPAEAVHKEEPKVEVVEEKPHVEEKPKDAEHKEEPKAEVNTHVEEPKKEEHVEQNNHHVQEEQKEVEKPEEKAAEVHEEKINHEVHENNGETNGNGEAHGKDNTEIVAELNSVLGYDVSGEVKDGNLNQFVNKQIKEADSQLKAVENQIDDFRKENVSESTEKKPYETKKSTQEFIHMLQKEWVSELKANDNWAEKMYQILVLLFLLKGNPDVPDVKDQAKLRAYAIEKLEKEETNLEGYLMALENNLNLDITKKIQIQEFLRDKNPVLNPSAFDGVDALCGVISFLMKEVCEYLGVIPIELAKKSAAKEKILALSLEKNDYLLKKKGKLIDIANKHGISVDE